jgi:hypothetical protein
MKGTRLVDLASAIRSKNAGIYHVTCDVMFDDWELYRRVRDSGVFTRESIALLYGIPEEQVVTVVAHDPGRGIKVTIRRIRPSGDPGDPDILGCQQHMPLYDIEVPE